MNISRCFLFRRSAKINRFRLLLLPLLWVLSAYSQAYILCSGVPVDNIQTGVDFELKSNITGPYMALDVDAQYCEGRSGEDVSQGVTLVLESFSNPAVEKFEVRRFWGNLLLVANSADTKISFSADSAGLGSNGRLLVKPYQFAAK